MTHTAPAVDQSAPPPPIGHNGPPAKPTAPPRIDMHVRLPRALVERLDARLQRRSLPASRTAAIAQAVAQWIERDVALEARTRGAPEPLPPTRNTARQPEPEHTGLREPTYHPID